jgi:WXG100 family type VII secretion target
MTTAAGGSLNTDFDVMAAVAAKIDTRNEEVRAMLRAFIGQMTSVPATVWGGVAAARFREVVDRWDAESLRLHAALQRIAETLKLNEQTLREAVEAHSHGIIATSNSL